MTVSIQELVLAYRKAKVDLYYSTHRRLVRVLEYEENLLENLQALRSALNGADDNYFSSEEFLGGWIPAGVKLDPADSGSANTAIFAEPAEAWNRIRDSDKASKSHFRVMSDCSVSFHVLSALWIWKVGSKLDAALGENAYGSRLRRNGDGSFNIASLGSFQPYSRPYRRWRQNGLDSIRSNLEAGRRICAVTADVSSYYHRLDNSYAGRPTFLSALGVNLDGLETSLHQRFLKCLGEWSKLTPFETGLPVGLSGSAVLANVALFELDKTLREDLPALHYGRYVDDLLVVFEDNHGIASVDEFWQIAASRSRGLIKATGNGAQLCADYLAGSRIEFSNEKNKLFLLEGDSGLAMTKSLEARMQQLSSEWRAFPNLDSGFESVGERILSATSADGGNAPTLRQTDSLTMRRAEFAIALRDLEHYARELPPAVWATQRAAFYSAVISHVVTPLNFLSFEGYLPRVVALSAQCGDFEQLRQVLEAAQSTIQEIQQHTRSAIKGWSPKNGQKSPSVEDNWARFLQETVQEAIAGALVLNSDAVDQSALSAALSTWRRLVAIDTEAQGSNSSVRDMVNLGKRLFNRDLGKTPFRYKGALAEVAPFASPSAQQGGWQSCGLEREFPEDTLLGLQVLTGWMRRQKTKKVPSGVAFATRPPLISELFICWADPFDLHGATEFEAVAYATRGFRAKHPVPTFNKDRVLEISGTSELHHLDVAVASWKTEFESWAAAASGLPDPDSSRHARMADLVNRVLEAPVNPRYFVMPELSISPRWFLGISLKLQKAGISTVGGVEYVAGGGSVVRNQAWAALSFDSLGFPATAIYRQDKQRAALHEEKELKGVSGKRVVPARPWTAEALPIVCHQGFYFAILICSELLNVDYASRLRGRIDALFVPEWNKDVDSYSALVAASAQGIHTYVIQCNDRRYGDSRIRVPHKNSWERDAVRVKGGLADYFLTGRIFPKKLRAFQSYSQSPDEPFKPVPDGFEISDDRAELPYIRTSSSS